MSWGSIQSFTFHASVLNLSNLLKIKGDFKIVTPLQSVFRFIERPCSDSALAQRAIETVATALLFTGEDKVFISQVLDLLDEGSKVVAVCVVPCCVVGETFGIIGKIGKPVDHLYLSGPKRPTLVEVGTSPNQ